MKTQYQIKLYKENRITLPAEYVDYLHVHAGDRLVVKLCEDGIKIQSDKLALEFIRNTLHKQIGDIDLAAEIINNRKNEVKNEKS